MCTGGTDLCPASRSCPRTSGSAGRCGPGRGQPRSAEVSRGQAEVTRDHPRSAEAKPRSAEVSGRPSPRAPHGSSRAILRNLEVSLNPLAPDAVQRRLVPAGGEELERLAAQHENLLLADAQRLLRWRASLSFSPREGTSLLVLCQRTAQRLPSLWLDLGTGVGRVLLVGAARLCVHPRRGGAI